MYKLCLGLSFAAVAMLVSCSGDNGSSVSDLVELPDPSEVVVIGSCASGESSSSSSDVADSGISKVSSSSRSKDAGFSEPGGSSSSSSQDTGSSESIDSSSSGSEDSGSSESGGLSSSSFEESSSSESEESSSSSEEESSSSEELESSSSVPSSSSDGSIYDATANTLTDLRDNQVYRTTTIEINDAESGIDYSEVWMAENLNIMAENSWCGGGNDVTEGDCSVFGRLYTWVAAVGKTENECGYEHACGLSEPVRGVCPEGWHLPSHDEWDELLTAVGGLSTAGTMLKTSTGWISDGNGTDNYGFSALPAGGRSVYGNFGFEGSEANFWGSTEDEGHAYNTYLTKGGSAHPSYSFKNNGFSIRCLKN